MLRRITLSLCETRVTSIRVESSGLTASLATTFLNFRIEALNMRKVETSSQCAGILPDKMGRRVVLHIVCYMTAHSLKIEIKTIPWIKCRYFLHAFTT